MFFRELSSTPASKNRTAFLPLIKKRFKEQLKEIIKSNNNDELLINLLSELVLFGKTKTPNKDFSALCLKDLTNDFLPLDNKELNEELKLLIIDELSSLMPSSVFNQQRDYRYVSNEHDKYWLATVADILVQVKRKPQKIKLIDTQWHFEEYFSEDKWLALYQLIKLAKVPRLFIETDAMRLWSDKILAILFNIIKDTELKQLSLRTGDLGKVLKDIGRWQLLCDAIQSSQLEILDFTGNFQRHDFLSISNEYWGALCQALQQSKVHTLNWGLNYSCNFTAIQWEQFALLLKNSSLTSLNLYRNDYGLNYATPGCWNSLFSAVADSHLIELNLDVCFLNKVPHSLWHAFGEMLKQSKIQSLSLYRNYLNELKDTGWDEFCDALSKSHLKTLNLRHNDLNQLSPKEWQAFGRMLKISPLYELNLVENNLHRMDAEQWLAFKEALIGTHIHKLILNHPKRDDLLWNNALSPDQMNELQLILLNNRTTWEQDKSGKEENTTMSFNKLS